MSEAGGRIKSQSEAGEPDLKERAVEIFSLDLLSFDGGEALVVTRCSSGTYIRSLARDIARACGSRAHLRSLQRLAIGPFRVDDAVDPAAFDPRIDLCALRREEACALGLRAIGLEDPRQATRFRNGGRIEPEAFSILDGGMSAVDCEAAVFGRNDDLLGIASLCAGGPKYRLVMPPAADAASTGRDG